MTPYYSRAGITLYHGDCREVLPTLPSGLVCVTDQPYGTGWVRGGGGVGEFNAKHEKPDWDKFATDWIPLLKSPKRIAAFCPVSKCEQMCSVLPFPAVLHYVKTNVRPNGINREPIVCSPPPASFSTWKREAYNGDAPLHPCQKPLDLMLWLVSLVSDNDDRIVDPFAGSGSTLVAAMKLERQCFGVEQAEEYAETIAKRLDRELAQGDLFVKREVATNV